jgi:hypothetical protein
MDATDAAFSCYCKLVSLELAFKDTDSGFYASGHDVIRMVLARYAQKPTICAAAIALEGAMSRIYCSGRNKAMQPMAMLVTPAKYPDLRYVRRQSDFARDVATEADLKTLQSKLNSLISELVTEGFVA